MAGFFENAFATLGSALERTANDHPDADAQGAAAPNTGGGFGNLGALVGEFRAGKPVELGRFSQAGFSGRIVAVPDGSDAAKALGFPE